MFTVALRSSVLAALKLFMGIFFERRNAVTKAPIVTKFYLGEISPIQTPSKNVVTIGAFVTELWRPKKMPMNSFNAANTSRRFFC